MTNWQENALGVVAFLLLVLAPAILIYIGGAFFTWDLAWIATSVEGRGWIVAIQIMWGLTLLIMGGT